MAPGSKTGVLEPPVLERDRSPSPPLQPPAAPPWDGPAPPFPPATIADEPPVRNTTLAMLLVIVFESMIFVALLGAFVVQRSATRPWPPAGQPFLPIGVTWVNTFVLLGSLLPLLAAGRALRRERHAAFVRSLAVAAAMGAIFLIVQGIEWTRLVAHGLTFSGASGNNYGAYFVALIGLHAAHVLAAVIWLATLAALAAAGRVGSGGRAAAAVPSVPGLSLPRRSTAFELCRMYWTFVAVLWVALFGLVYLA